MASILTRPDSFRITRVQRNVVAQRERRFLNYLCDLLPTAVQPDHLTLIGIGGAALVFASYFASRFDPAFLWLASLGYIIHWFGDSLDGSLARYRNIERPTYGYFLDHTVDALCNLLIMGGLGLTLYVRMDAALFALVGYYLVCIYVFINNHLSGIFQLSFVGFGPTELRIGLIAINTAMFFGGHVGIGDGALTIYDAILIFTGATFTFIFVTMVLAGVRELRETSP